MPWIPRVDEKWLQNPRNSGQNAGSFCNIYILKSYNSRAQSDTFYFGFKNCPDAIKFLNKLLNCMNYEKNSQSVNDGSQEYYHEFSLKIYKAYHHCFEYIIWDTHQATYVVEVTSNLLADKSL